MILDEGVPAAVPSERRAGQTDRALTLVERGLSFNHRVFAAPVFAPLRSDPRSEPLVERKLGRDVDLPW